jgi:hypothetical protein
MKKSAFLFLVTWGFISITNAQALIDQKSKLSAGISFSTCGKYDILTFNHPDGSPTYSSPSFYSFGISGFIKNKKWTETETGIYFVKHEMQIRPGFSETPNYSTRESISLIEIPINIRFELKYFFISSGIIADIEIANSNIIRNQSGIGINTSLGLNYKFKFGMSVYTGPEFYLHSLLPPEDEKLIGRSVKIGIRFH